MWRVIGMIGVCFPFLLHTDDVANGFGCDVVPAGDTKFYRSPFLRDFWHLNVAMMTSNNALIPDPDKEDILASKPFDWPFLHLGLRMCGWRHAAQVLPHGHAYHMVGELGKLVCGIVGVGSLFVEVAEEVS